MRRYLWNIFLALDALLVASFAAGYVAYYVRPSFFWWIELIAVALPYLSLFVLLATIPLILGKRWLVAGVHFLLIVLILVRADPFSRLLTDRKAHDDDLAVLTFNVPRWWGYQMPEKTSEMAEFVADVGPDVISLQEAPIEYHREDPSLRAAPYVAVLFDSLGFHSVGPRGGRTTWTPQPVLSRHELVEQAEYRLRQNPADSFFTRVTRTHLRWKGRDFALYNVHLRTFGEKKPWRDERLPTFRLRNLIPYLRRYREAYQVRAWEIQRILEMLEEEEMPVIVCGDLNSTPNNWVHGRLTNVLRDTFAEKGLGWGMTYHTNFPVVRIDYVFVSREWQIVSADVLEADLSDHLPLLVRLRWREG